jgi:DNA-directed RNA polymerase specialized sigma subunit
MLAVINDNSKPSLAFMVESFNFKLHIDTMEKLKLVKSNVDMVIDLADRYSKKTEKPFSQMLKVGMSSAVKAVKTYHRHYNVEFEEYLRKEVSNAMTNFSDYQL